MTLSRTLTSVTLGALVAGVTLVAVAGPASAMDEGAALDGNIYLFSQPGGFDGNTAATQVSSGNGTTRPWQSVTVDPACPAGTAYVTAVIRIPQQGVPDDELDSIELTAVGLQKDSAGRFYANRGDLLSKSQVLAYLAGRPGNTGELPFLVACRGAAAGETYGHVMTSITMTGTTAENLTWSIPRAPFPGGGQSAAATTTSLAATAQGRDLTLTATVAPGGATGTVTFTEGGTTLGTAPVADGTATLTVTAPAAGPHTYAAAFTPADATAFAASQGTTTVTVGLDSGSGQIVVTVPAAPEVDGALTFTVPFGTPVALAGTRAVDNSRVAAAGAFPTVTVTDTRRDGLLTGWEVNAQASDFIGTAGTVGAKYLGWTPATPTMQKEAGSGLVAQAGPPVASVLDSSTSAGLGASSLLGRAQTPGRGTTTLDAALALAIPGSTAEGAYTSTVTVTLVSQ